MDPNETLPQVEATNSPPQDNPKNEDGPKIWPTTGAALISPTHGFDFKAQMKNKIEKSKYRPNQNLSIEVRPRRHSPEAPEPGRRLRSVWDSENDLQRRRNSRIPSPPPGGRGSRFRGSVSYVQSTPLEDLSPMLKVKDYLTFAAFLAPLRIHHVVIPKLLDEEVLGEGVTFRVSRCSLPPGTAASVSGIVALKRVKSKGFNLTRVAAVDEKIVRDLCLEMRILLHPPLRRHRNIVGIFSIGWEISDDSKRTPLPLLIMECAELGNLQDYQSTINFSWKEKSHLCLEIASGLQSLHECGIIHGDVKSENILLFHDKEHMFVSKLADFSCSLLDEDAELGSKVILGGTRPWAAPEIFEGPIRARLAPMTDVFSFGLLVWRVCIDGQNPFLEVPFNTGPDEKVLDIQDWKKHDDFVQICTNRAKVILRKAPEACCIRLPKVMEATLNRNPELRSSMEDILEILGHKIETTNSTQSLETVPKIFVPTHTGEAPKEILNCMLLDDKYTQSGQDLPSGVKRQIFSELLERASGLGPRCCQDCNTRTKIDDYPETLTFSDLAQLAGADACPYVTGVVSVATEAAFELCYCFVVGFGVEVCYTKALYWLGLAAKNGLNRAQAVFKQLHDSFNIGIPENLPYMKWLLLGMMAGSRESSRYLSQHSPKFHKVLQEVFLRVYQGRGWRFWTDGYLGISWPVENIPLLKQQVLKYYEVHGIPLDDISVDGDPNDGLLHLSAACGFPDTLKFLHEIMGANVNKTNRDGETPLLAACRSGQIKCLDILLSYHADVQAVTKNGTTALHWLLSFGTSADMQYVCQRLHSLKADLNAKSSAIQLTLQGCTPILFCGTPLHWAITVLNFDAAETLIKQGADPRITNELGKSPLQLAASLHFIEGVNLLLQYAEEKSFLDLIRISIRDISPFFHRMQFGSLWRNTAIETATVLITAASSKAIDYIQILEVLCSESVRRWPMDLVDSLLDAVPKPHGQIPLSPDPLQYTIRSERFEDFTRLLQRYLESFGFDACTCLPLLLTAASTNDPRFIQTLLKYGSNPCLRGQDGFSLFEIAVISKAFKTADSILESLPDSARELCFGAYSPEVFGAQHGSLTTIGHLLFLPQLGIDSLEYMLKLKADIGFIVSPTSNANVFHVAAATFQVSERPEIVRRYRRYLSILLKYFNPNQLNSVDNFGRTPLHWAAEAGNVEAVREFLKARVKLDHRGENAGTALDKVNAILQGMGPNDSSSRELVKTAGKPRKLFEKIQKLLIDYDTIRGGRS